MESLEEKSQAAIRAVKVMPITRYYLWIVLPAIQAKHGILPAHAFQAGKLDGYQTIDKLIRDTTEIVNFNTRRGGQVRILEATELRGEETS